MTTVDYTKAIHAAEQAIDRITASCDFEQARKADPAFPFHSMLRAVNALHTARDALRAAFPETVSRPVFAALAAAGVACQEGEDGTGTFGKYVFTDGLELTWWCEDVWGNRGLYRPLEEHKSLHAYWCDPWEETEGACTFDDGEHAEDVAAFVHWVSALAVLHGRAEQPSYAFGEDRDAACAWAAEYGAMIAPAAREGSRSE